MVFKFIWLKSWLSKSIFYATFYALSVNQKSLFIFLPTFSISYLSSILLFSPDFLKNLGTFFSFGYIVCIRFFRQVKETFLLSLYAYYFSTVLQMMLHKHHNYKYRICSFFASPITRKKLTELVYVKPPFSTHPINLKWLYNTISNKLYF